MINISYTCDRCGNAYEPVEEIVNQATQVKMRTVCRMKTWKAYLPSKPVNGMSRFEVVGTIDNSERYFDLCPNCYNELSEVSRER